MKRIAKERVIYNNYDLDKNYPDDELKEIAIECNWVDEDEEITNEMLWDWRYYEDETDWDATKADLTNFFKGKTVGFFGEVGRWNGVYKAGKIGEFWDLFDDAIEDCYYIKIYDENGKLFLTCSHHDGTCHFEIKEVTDKGSEYLNNWEYNYGDKRTEQYVHNQIYKRYSRNPRFSQKVYGCKPVEYEKQSKEAFQRQLANQARSFYS